MRSPDYKFIKQRASGTLAFNTRVSLVVCFYFYLLSFIYLFIYFAFLFVVVVCPLPFYSGLRKEGVLRHGGAGGGYFPGNDVI